MYFCTEGDSVSQISGGRGGLTFESMQDIRPHTVGHDKPLSYGPERLQKIYAEGRLQTRTYTAKGGTEKTVTEVVLDEMVMLDKMPEDVKETLDLKDAANGAPVQV